MTDDPAPPTHGSWSDRLTYLLAQTQTLIAGVLISIGLAFVWLKPDLPGVPGWVYATLAAALLLGPLLLGFFVTLFKKLRTRNWVTVHHINGVTDTREKYEVAPETWSQKTVEGPSPYPVNDGDAFEVREFEYYEDQEELIVTGCYFSKLADSKLISVQAMLEDVHGQLIETAIAYNKLRARISKMGVEIEKDTVNYHAEADERGLIGAKTAVKKRFEDAEDDAGEWDSDEIQDLGDYEHDYHPVENPRGDPLEPGERPAAATDGGSEP